MPNDDQTPAGPRQGTTLPGEAEKLWSNDVIWKRINEQAYQANGRDYDMVMNRHDIRDLLIELRAAWLADRAVAAALAPHAVGQPAPNWQDVPEWANYWTHDSTGNAMMWETKPFYDSKYGIWINEDDSRRAQGTVAAVIHQCHTVPQAGTPPTLADELEDNYGI